MSFDPRAALTDLGFTPGAKHFAALFDLLGSADDDEYPAVIRVLARAGEAAREVALSQWDAASERLQERLLRLLARLGSNEARTLALCLAALEAPDTRVRRAAARALGKLDPSDERAEAALLNAHASADPPLARAIVEALGKIGGKRSLALLETVPSDGSELARLARRSSLMVTRSSAREEGSEILLDAPLPRALPVVARTRSGLTSLAQAELSALGRVEIRSTSRVELEHAGSLGALHIARTALDFGIRIKPNLLTKAERERSARGGPAEKIAAQLTSEAAVRAFRAWTRGPIRFRLELEEGGHRRADVWKIAELVAASGTGLVNDAREAAWEVFVPRDFEHDGLALFPRGYVDPRFSYRKRQVPAASHPTLAAALARVAEVRPDDVVWDPFCGSALELVERAKLGPYRRLIGTDREQDALGAARENLAAAGVREVTLERADALKFEPGPVDLILTNPPMGRRLARDGSVAQLLEKFVARARRILAPKGRMVWLSPLPDNTLRAAQDAGLQVERIAEVDMSGFPAELQVLRRT